MAIFVKDPGARIDYAVDWSAGYLTVQEITGSVWAVAPDGIGSPVVEAATFGPGKTGVTLSGGVAGCVYRISNRVQFSDGRSDERTLVVRVEER